MASVWKKGNKKQTKSSSLDMTSTSAWDKTYSDGIAPTEGKPTIEKVRRNSIKQDNKEWITVSRSSSKRLAWVSDIIVLVLLALLVVGCVFGYRTLKKNAIEPDIKTVWVEYQVVLYEVPQDTDLTGWTRHTMKLVSDAKEHSLGTVQRAEWDEVVPRMARVTVRVETQYEAGKGYRVEDLRLMAGVTPTDAKFHVIDVASTGMITALQLD